MFKFDPKNVENFANKIRDIMPESLKTSKEEMQKTLRSGAEGVIQKLDLVSREEYDALLRRIEKLENIIKILKEPNNSDEIEEENDEKPHRRLLKKKK